MGHFAFVDYAITFWIRHLEAGLTRLGEGQDDFTEDEPMKGLSESLECFLDIHWASPTASLPVSKRTSERLERFKDAPFYDTLEQAVVSTRKQLTFYGRMKKEEIALDLGNVILRVRATLEAALSLPMDKTAQDHIQEMYGINLYKCSRLSCNYFSNGFSTSDLRDQHLEKHDRPFHCTVGGCPIVVFGLTTAKELEKHMKDTHSALADQEQEFPTENEVNPPREFKIPAPVLSAPKVREKMVYYCVDCSRVFSRSFNLRSHLATHKTETPYACTVCQQRFRRQNDCKRHENSHGGERFTCKGVLKDGSPWGCGREFICGDSLRNHHKSKVGQQCILPVRREKELEQGSSRAGVADESPQNENLVAYEI